MIVANFNVNKAGDILGFDICGHSGYGARGNDIVCAAVSSACYMAANTIVDILKVNADVSVDNIGRMSLSIDENDISKCRDMLLGLKMHLIALEEQYPENINVNYTEV